MSWPRCVCRLAQRSSPHSATYRHASTALPSSAANLDEKLVKLARQTLSKAAAAASDASSLNDYEYAKRLKQLEGVRESLQAWQKQADVCFLETVRRTPSENP
jgi:hypothetical protein